MSSLLLQSCSNTKQETDTALPALDLYSGYFYKIIKKSKREGEIRPDLDICILSAKHGLLQPDELIERYDRRMDAARARELKDSVQAELRELIQQNGYDQVIINMGKTYRKAINGFDENLDITTTVVTGDGIGEKGHVLKRVLRGEDSLLEVAN